MLALLGVAGDTGTFVGAGRIAALLITGARHTALIIVHTTCGIHTLRHLTSSTIAACTLWRQLAVVAAVQSRTGGVLLICGEHSLKEKKKQG